MCVVISSSSDNFNLDTSVVKYAFLSKLCFVNDAIHNFYPKGVYFFLYLGYLTTSYITFDTHIDEQQFTKAL